MWYNSMMAWLLRSPMHELISQNFMLVTVTGKKSSKPYTTPVNYSREGNMLTVISHRDRTWWRNLRGGCPLTIHLQGRDFNAVGMVIEDDAGVTRDLADYLQKNPQLAKYFSVSLDTAGQPSTQDVAQAAGTRVVVQIGIGDVK